MIVACSAGTYSRVIASTLPQRIDYMPTVMVAAPQDLADAGHSEERTSIQRSEKANHEGLGAEQWGPCASQRVRIAATYTLGR